MYLANAKSTALFKISWCTIGCNSHSDGEDTLLIVKSPKSSSMIGTGFLIYLIKYSDISLEFLVTISARGVAAPVSDPWYNRHACLFKGLA